MAQKASIYKKKDMLVNSDLLKQLNEAFVELEEKMKATIPIRRLGAVAGYGVNKTQRSIAADLVISIARAIKALKGW